MKKTVACLILVIYACFSFPRTGHTQEPTVFTYRAPESSDDKRYEFDNNLLKLALDKTVEKYGPYKLEPSPVMNFSRTIYELEHKQLPNFMAKLSYEDTNILTMDYVPIPTDLGIVGYRVFFVSPQAKDKVAAVKTLDDLKKFTIVQGNGWTDVKILEAEGFKVLTLPVYQQLFSYVAAGHADLLSRGANELLDEYESYKGQVKDLDYDRSLILYYPLPRFFFTSKGNEAAVKRITEGMQMAWEDGSFMALWKKEYQRNVDFLDMKHRRIIRMENPMIKTLGDGYKKYLYDPEK